MAASTLLRTETHDAFLCVNIWAGITQIFPHRDVDMWGVFEWAVLGGVAES